MPTALGYLNDTLSTTFVWTPGYHQSGYYKFNFLTWRSDVPLPAVPFGQVGIILLVEDVNAPPVISEIDRYRQVRAGLDSVKFGFILTNNDCNCPPEGDTMVSIAAYEGATPLGTMTLNGTGCQYLWVPSVSDVGIHTLEIRALDSRGGESRKSFTVEVLPSGAVIDPIGEVELSGSFRL